MNFIADIHVHSRFSRATALNLDLEHLYIAAQLKGVTLVGTGDFTHPGWLSELQEKLIPAEPGLFKLKEEIAQQCDHQVPQSCRRQVRFILQCEISNIYKKNGMTRKNHSVILLPDMACAYRLSAKLGAIGNIKSDGRPILGLDTRNLLEILLEISESSALIPAHIWTPWFSVLGSKSGFDSLQECFEDLLPHVFAAETGLSSDPPMNWRVSDLDNITLVSNSDAHSPANMGRNANIFDTELSYPAVYSALKTGDPVHCKGTIDLYPEEGKYHYDGHRKCNVCLHPTETLSNNGICPACGKPLTIGVLYRVEELADRPYGDKPKKHLPCHHIIPLPEMLSEILNVGSRSKKVNEYYQSALEILGSELDILLTFPIEFIEKAGIPLIGESIRRMRIGDVHISPGFDGEYGKITLFESEEKEKLLGKQTLFIMPASKPVKKRKSELNSPPTPLSFSKRGGGSEAEGGEFPKKETPIISEKQPPFQNTEADILRGLNEQQLQAVKHEGSPLLIVAGPGAGKTRTLTNRIAYLITERKVRPANILAVTFTNKAASEMKDRLKLLLNTSELPLVATFHSLCFNILNELDNTDPLTKSGIKISIIDEDERNALFSEAIDQVKRQGISVDLKADVLLDMVISAKQHLLSYQDDLQILSKEFRAASETNLSILSAVYQAYQTLLSRERLLDFDDLILNVVKRFESDQKVQTIYQERFQYVFVDEYQDLNQGQYRIIIFLSSPDRELCVIGDPDQAIYGFRGADVGYFGRFREDFPTSTMIRLTQNYRSTESILEASHQVIKNHSINPTGARVYSNIHGVTTLTILEAPTEKAEAVAVGKTIECMVGGTGFFSIDFDKTDETGIKTDRAFSDFAVLYRTSAQSKVISEIFESAGIPYQIASKEHVYGRKGIAELISLLKITEHIGIFNDFQKIINLADFRIDRKTFEIFKSWFYQNKNNLSESLINVKRFPVTGLDSAKRKALILCVDNILELQKNMPQKSVEEKLMFLVKNTTLSEIIPENRKTEEVLNTLLNTAKMFAERTTDFFEMIAFQTDPDTANVNSQKVTLITMHAAKGLEFPVVFITGCENDFIPFIRSKNAQVDMDEERRLLYVAMTRAKERLFITYAKNRTIYGKSVERELSPFVTDIENHLITLKKSHAGKTKLKRENEVQLDLFK